VHACVSGSMLRSPRHEIFKGHLQCIVEKPCIVSLERYTVNCFDQALISRIHLAPPRSIVPSAIDVWKSCLQIATFRGMFENGVAPLQAIIPLAAAPISGIF